MDQHRDLNSKRTTDTTSVERTSSNSSSHDKHHIYRILGLEKTTDTESFESCRESPNQSAAFLNSPNIHQLQRQFVAPNNFLNAYDKENQIVGSHNYANVSQPQWQVGAPFDIPNVNQTQWQVGATYNIAHAIERQEQIGVHCNNPTVHQPLGQIAASGNCPNVPEPQSNSADCPKFFDRQRLRHLRQLYGPVFEDCDDVRRKIREYHSCICRNALEFARAINVPLESLGDFLDLRRQGFDDGADSIVYPAAYYYFERMRIDYHAGKSRHRLWSEKHYPYGYELTTKYVPTRLKS